MTMTNRRTFTFASLGLAVSTAARGAIPELEPQLQQAPAPAPSLSASWSLSKDKDELVAKLTLANLSRDPVDVLAARGSSPAPDVTAFLEVDGEDIELSRAFTDVDRRDLMSRMGPRPRWEPVASNGKVQIGEYRFSLPPDVGPETVRLVAQVQLDSGPIELAQSGMTWTANKTKV